MTFQQLWDDQLDVELASSDTTQLFTTARRKAAVNLAQDAFARMTGCTKRYGVIPIVDGTGEYEIEATLTDYIRLAGDASIKIVNGSTTTYIQGSEAFPRRDVEELDDEEPNWRAASAGRPGFWYVREDGGATYLGVSPAPDVTGVEVWSWLLPYVADPPDMSANGDEPFTFSSNVLKRLAAYHQGLVHYAAGQLEPLRKNYSGVTRQMQLYSGYVAQYLQDTRSTGRDQIRLERAYYDESRGSGRAKDPRSWP